MSITLEVSARVFPLARVFRISRGARIQAEVIEVSLKHGSWKGWGESVPYSRYGESIESVTSQLERVANLIGSVDDHQHLADWLPAGAARNALDCAFWDLKAKIAERSVADMLDLPVAETCFTAQTISIDSIENMRESAKALQGSPLIKVKLDPESVVEKIKAIHEATPLSRLIVDANEAWKIDDLRAVAGPLKEYGVVLIEQPLPADEDAALEGYECPIPLCADESCHTSKDLAGLRGRYQAVNIKLDKTGGLSEAMALYNMAKTMGFSIMVGCMVGSSLAMAPAYLLCKQADFVDLDGPILMAEDRVNGFCFDNGRMWQPSKGFLWGTGRNPPEL